MVLKPDPITEDDIAEYIATNSDFAFEMQVLNKMNERGMRCEHGGSYTDPVTGKPREFDIRTEFSLGGIATQKIYLAVECKNIRTHYPLVAHCVPRRRHEAFHQLVKAASDSGINPYGTEDNVVHIPTKQSYYSPGKYIAKSLDNIGRNINKKNELVGGDSDTYSRYAQALSSCHDLFEKALSQDNGTYSMILPMLVVPKNTLWEVHYSEEGGVLGLPKLADYIDLFVDYRVSTQDPTRNCEYRISHLRIVAIDALGRLLESIKGSGIDFHQSYGFPKT